MEWRVLIVQLLYSWRFSSPLTTFLAFYFPFPIVYSRGILGFSFCFAFELLEHGWEVWERLKSNRIKGGFCHTESWQNIMLDLGWQIIRTGSTLEIGPTSVWLLEWLGFVIFQSWQGLRDYSQVDLACSKGIKNIWTLFTWCSHALFIQVFSLVLLCSFGVSLFHVCLSGTCC